MLLISVYCPQAELEACVGKVSTAYGENAFTLSQWSSAHIFSDIMVLQEASTDGNAVYFLLLSFFYRQFQSVVPVLLQFVCKESFRHVIHYTHSLHQVDVLVLITLYI